MGRRKQVLSETEIEERKQRWWGEARNARRRERYAKDPAYRERAIQQVRESYRKSREDAGLPLREEDCRNNLDRLAEFGMLREVKIDEEHTMRMLTFFTKELAKALDRNPAVVQRWINSGLIPPPVIIGKSHTNRWYPLYTVTEVRAIMAVFGEHQQTSQYFRTYHTETREKMHAAVREARKAVVRGQPYERTTSEAASTEG
jgi:hypothetical protein